MTNVVILGAGAIGCYVGAEWSEPLEKAGKTLTLIGRPSVVGPLARNGVVADDVQAEGIHFSTDARELAQADLIVLSMKAHGLNEAMDEIHNHGNRRAVILSLLNGLSPVRVLKERFPDRDIVAGMVPYNVVWTSDTSLHKTGSGLIALADHPVTQALRNAGCPIEVHSDLSGLQRGKLLLNLIGAVNGLSGLPIHAMLKDRGFRRIYAAALSEALAVYRAADLSFEQVGPTSPKVAIPMLRAPNWLFEPLVLKRQGLDPSSMTSLAVDLQAGRKTEIEILNGEICKLGSEVDYPTPVNDALVRLVKAAERAEAPPNTHSDALVAEVLS